MGNRWFQVVIVLFWMSTMGWLVVEKILPPLLVGDPPSYYQSLPRTDAPICWEILWNDKPLGWAAIQARPGVAGITEVETRVVLESLPLNELLPAWLGAIIRHQVANIDMDAQNWVEIDAGGKLLGFTAFVRLAEMEKAITMRGRVEGSDLNLRLQVGEFKYQKSLFLKPGALLGNELSPQANLPDLRLGQAWTLRSYSPFRSPNSPLEVLQAKVERDELLLWNGRAVETLVVVYRADAGVGLGNAAPRGVLWVARDGKVLQQEIRVLNSAMRFVRVPEGAAERYRARLESPGRNRQWLDSGAPNGGEPSEGSEHD